MQSSRNASLVPRRRVLYGVWLVLSYLQSAKIFPRNAPIKPTIREKGIAYSRQGKGWRWVPSLTLHATTTMEENEATAHYPKLDGHKV